MTKAKIIHPARFADGRVGTRHIFVRDLVIPCRIGVHKHERKKLQPVRINLDLSVQEASADIGDSLENVVCYEQIVDGVRAIVRRDHVNLVETLAERIAELCLADRRVRAVRVRVEKLEVFEDVESVGVEIERFSASY